MKIGIDLDDVMAICSVPYLRRFAQEFNVELPDESQIGWHLLSQKESGAGYDPSCRASSASLPNSATSSIRLYDSTSSRSRGLQGLPVVLSAWSGQATTYFITRRAERGGNHGDVAARRDLRHAKAVHLKPSATSDRSTRAAV